MSYDYLLFDLDGTLTQSGPGIMHSAAWALEQLGIDPGGEEQLRRVVGPPLSESYRRFYGLSPEQTEEAVRLFRVWYNEQGGIFESEPYPHVPAMLRALKERGKHLLVATSKPEPLSLRILEHFGLMPYFEGLAGSTMDEKRTKKGEVIAYALKTFQLDPAETIMVGDRKHDVEGARENGLPCIGVLYGYGSREELAAAGAAALAEDLPALASLLKS
jgi:phosphoglycolate phosphatase